MIYALLLVFVAVAIWRAGWRKASKSLECCHLPHLRSDFLDERLGCPPQPLGRSARHPLLSRLCHPPSSTMAQWLNLLTPTGIVAAVWLLFIALRKTASQQLRMMKTSLIRAVMVNFDQFCVCKLGRADERIHGENCRYEWQFTAVSSGIDTTTTYVRVFLTGSITC